MLKLSPKCLKREEEKLIRTWQRRAYGQRKKQSIPRMMLQIKTLKLFPRFILSLSWKWSSQCLVVGLNLHERLINRKKQARIKVGTEHLNAERSLVTKRLKESRWETIFHSWRLFLASCFCTRFLFFVLPRLGAFEFFLSPIIPFNGVKSKLFSRCEAKEDPRRYKFHTLMVFYHLLRGCEG